MNGGPEAFCGVLENRDIPFVANRLDGRVVAALAVEIDRDKRARPSAFGGKGFDGAA